ncbi:hypothetical protein, partial [Leptolyngbya sp. FACHB-711]|uniref:hypothetical protein n=1 Tax=Leptolyngbya sp. FACHB-711 TaxID=2692813 RepID=UPI0016850647
ASIFACNSLAETHQIAAPQTAFNVIAKTQKTIDSAQNSMQLDIPAHRPFAKAIKAENFSGKTHDEDRFAVEWRLVENLAFCLLFVFPVSISCS